ncbi:hypothetical protein F5B18DRAFT_629523 [Nemania serpens]|nr:hypothetical protein F5B18DRAFT_629523 [Nemania serpens]
MRQTPSSLKGNNGGVVEGAVDNKGVRSDVVMGNVQGYNFMIAHVTIAAQYGTASSKAIRDFIGRVEFSDRLETVRHRLKYIAARIDATTIVLDRLGDLVILKAQKENITITKDIAEDSPNANDGGSVDSVPDVMGMSSEVLTRQCFKDLKGACVGTRTSFKNISQKLYDADRLRSELAERNPAISGETEAEVTEADMGNMFLLESDIEFMEKEVQAHSGELQLSFDVFSCVLFDGNLEEIKRMVFSTWKAIESLTRYLTGGAFYGKWYAPRTYSFGNTQRLGFPDLSRITSIYMSWQFCAVKPDYDPGPGASKIPWKFSGPIKLTLSTEELFFKVLAQISQRAKLNRTLWDDYRELSKCRSKRTLVDNLLKEQNATLKKVNPQLEWTLAGLELMVRKKWGRVQEPRTITVILKTQFIPEPLQTGDKDAQVQGNTDISKNRVGRNLALVIRDHGKSAGNFSKSEDRRRSVPHQPTYVRKIDGDMGHESRSEGNSEGAEVRVKHRRPMNRRDGQFDNSSPPSRSTAPISVQRIRSSDSNALSSPPRFFIHSNLGNTSLPLGHDNRDEAGEKGEEKPSEESKVVDQITGSWKTGKKGGVGIVRQLIKMVEDVSKKRNEKEMVIKASLGIGSTGKPDKERRTNGVREIQGTGEEKGNGRTDEVLENKTTNEAEKNKGLSKEQSIRRRGQQLHEFAAAEKERRVKR